jgi:hypothetical protein
MLDVSWRFDISWIFTLQEVRAIWCLIGSVFSAVHKFSLLLLWYDCHGHMCGQGGVPEDCAKYRSWYMAQLTYSSLSCYVCTESSNKALSFIYIYIKERERERDVSLSHETSPADLRYLEPSSYQKQQLCHISRQLGLLRHTLCFLETTTMLYLPSVGASETRFMFPRNNNYVISPVSWGFWSTLYAS